MIIEKYRKLRREDIYHKKKDDIVNKIHKFHSSDDLVLLMEVVQLAISILEGEEFPLKEYKKWKKK